MLLEHTEELTVAIDVDGVLADHVTHALKRANSEMGVQMTRSQITQWNTKVGTVPFTDLIAKYLIDPEFVLSMPVIPGAKEGLNRILQMAEAFIASTRPTVTESETINWIATNFEWEPKFVNTTGKGKSKLPADFLIDDYAQNLRDFVLSDPRKKGIIFSQRWNADEIEIVDMIRSGRIVRANTWVEIGDIMTCNA